MKKSNLGEESLEEVLGSLQFSDGCLKQVPEESLSSPEEHQQAGDHQPDAAAVEVCGASQEVLRDEGSDPEEEAQGCTTIGQRLHMFLAFLSEVPGRNVLTGTCHLIWVDWSN